MLILIRINVITIFIQIMQAFDLIKPDNENMVFPPMATSAIRSMLLINTEKEYVNWSWNMPPFFVNFWHVSNPIGRIIIIFKDLCAPI